MFLKFVKCFEETLTFFLCLCVVGLYFLPCFTVFQEGGEANQQKLGISYGVNCSFTL